MLLHCRIIRNITHQKLTINHYIVYRFHKRELMIEINKNGKFYTGQGDLEI